VTSNPYQRLRKACGIQQKEFANKYGFSHASMTAIEGGTVPNLSDRMIVALGKECAAKDIDARAVLVTEYGVATLSEAYQNWKANERMAVAQMFRKPLTGNETFERSPFADYVEDVAGGVTQFAKLLKVPLSAVQMYANGKILTMPKVVKEGLTQVRFDQIDILESIQSKWTGRGMSVVRVRKTR
jgi:DNA-binding XRE family transcriptional regulator